MASRGERIPLCAIRPYSTKKPKGFAPYKPNAKTIPAVARIIETFERIAAADALPLGPRQTGYRLKSNYPGEYSKADFKAIEEIVKRLGQAGKIPFPWIADAGSVTRLAGGYPGLEDFAAELPDLFSLDRRSGQPLVIEIYAETRETLPLITRVAHELGVSTYSGGGSKGPKLAWRVAARAAQRAVEHDQSTLILGICDFDVPGVRNILRPHIEHLAAFLYGSTAVAARDSEGDLRRIDETNAAVSFEHLALTPTMALDLVESDRERIAAYIDSGSDLWSRDLDLLAPVQKIETEALDPIELRGLVIDAIESRLDRAALAAADEIEGAGRERLRSMIATAGFGAG